MHLSDAHVVEADASSVRNVVCELLITTDALLWVCLLSVVDQAGADCEFPARAVSGRADQAATDTVGAGYSSASGLNFAPSPSRVGGYVNGSMLERPVPDRGSGRVGAAPTGARVGDNDCTFPMRMLLKLMRAR